MEGASFQSVVQHDKKDNAFFQGPRGHDRATTSIAMSTDYAQGKNFTSMKALQSRAALSVV